MSSISIENPKRKNTDRRVFQWWLLVIGFWVGVVVAVIVIGSRPQPQPSQAVNPYGQISMDALWMTATALIQGATATANAAGLQSFIPAESDPMAMTATAIIQQATQLAPP
jgi:hypothetical protein